MGSDDLNLMQDTKKKEKITSKEKRLTWLKIIFCDFFVIIKIFSTFIGKILGFKQKNANLLGFLVLHKYHTARIYSQN